MSNENKKVFLVEDDSAIVDIYKMMIEKAGFDVEVFGLGQEVISAIKRINNDGQVKSPDIVLLDLILPDINGIEVLRELKTNETTKNTKVFILTNQDDVKFEESDAIKPDKIIIKANITPTQLVDTIKNELSQ